MSSDINLVALSRRNLPIAQMRPVYRVGDVEKRVGRHPTTTPRSHGHGPGPPMNVDPKEPP